MSFTEVVPVGTGQEMPPPALNLVLKKAPDPISRQLLDLTLDRITQIADTYRKWATFDILSAKLLEWSYAFVTFAAEDDEAYVQGLLDRIQLLYSKILVSSFDTAPLTHPRVVDNVIWEEWIWQEVQPHIPHTTSRVHAFAYEVIAWMNDLPITLTPCKPMLDRKLIESNRTEADQAVKVAIFSCMQDVYKTKSENLRLQLMMQDDMKQCGKMWEDARRDVTERIAILSESLQQLTIMQREEVETIKGQCQAKLEERDREIESLQAACNRLHKRLTTAENSNTLQADEIRELRQLFAQKCAQVQELKHKVEKKSNGCVIA